MFFVSSLQARPQQIRENVSNYTKTHPLTSKKQTFLQKSGVMKWKFLDLIQADMI